MLGIAELKCITNTHVAFDDLLFHHYHAHFLLAFSLCSLCDNYYACYWTETHFSVIFWSPTNWSP